MRMFLMGALAASVLWAGLSWGQQWITESDGNSLTLYPLEERPDAPQGWYDTQGRSGTIMPLSRPGASRPPC